MRATTDVGWAEVERLADLLAGAVRAAGVAYERVVGVARGGLVPAALVAVRLGVRRVESVQVRHYDGALRSAEPRIVGEPPRSEPSPTLVVDDVYESGGTYRALEAVLPGATFGALVIKGPAATGRPAGGVELR